MDGDALVVANVIRWIADQPLPSEGSARFWGGMRQVLAGQVLREVVTRGQQWSHVEEPHYPSPKTLHAIFLCVEVILTPNLDRRFRDDLIRNLLENPTWDPRMEARFQRDARRLEKEMRKPVT
jgi:hypothetical protein